MSTALQALSSAIASALSAASVVDEVVTQARPVTPQELTSAAWVDAQTMQLTASGAQAEHQYRLLVRVRLTKRCTPAQSPNVEASALAAAAHVAIVQNAGVQQASEYSLLFEQLDLEPTEADQTQALATIVYSAVLSVNHQTLQKVTP